MSTQRRRPTAKQEAFALNYFTMRNATQAAIKAGYSPHLAHTVVTGLLHNPTIKARLDELNAGIVSSTILSKQQIEERLSEIARNGNPKQADPVMAIRELNKMGGYYAPEKRIVLGDIIIEVVYGNRRKAEDENTG